MERGFYVFKRGLRASVASMVLVSLMACGQNDELPDGFELENSYSQEGIISGSRSSVKDYPSTGAILFTSMDRDGSMTGSMLCSGTLIAPDVVLAAAHCNLGLLKSPYHNVKYYFSLSLNVANFGRRGVVLPPKTVRIAKVVAHPHFILDFVTPGLGHGNDIALMYLNERITSVTPTSLVTSDEEGVLQAGRPVAIAGYGRRHNIERDNDYGIKYHGVTTLNRVGRYEMQVSRGDPQPHKCHGDSGGPTFMIINDYKTKKPRLALIGVTSHAFDDSDCLSGGVDTRVDKYTDWIQAEMSRACRDGRRPACISTHR